ncbi:hypothetical protein P7C70_g4939, partial [Phenoliferia sp. Uapishka_3]
MFCNLELAQIFQYFHDELTSMIKLQKDANNQYAGHFHDFPHGHIATSNAKKFEDPRTMAVAISVDGASMGGNVVGGFWAFMLSTFNFPPASYRFRSHPLFDLLIPWGPNQASNLESFAYPIFERLAEAAEGLWTWDEVKGEWFLHKTYLILCLVDAMEAIKLSSMATARGNLRCDGCEIRSCTKESGAGHSYIRGAHFFYEKEAPKKGGGTRTVNAKQEEFRYLEKPAPARTPSQHRTQITAMYAPGVSESKRKQLRTDDGITKASLVSHSPCYSATFGFHPPTSPTSANSTSLKLSSISKMMEDARAMLPTIFGSAARNVCDKRQSAIRMFEWELFFYTYDIPTLWEAGFPQENPDHLAIWVEFFQLRISWEQPTIATIDKLDSLAELFNLKQEELYVENNLDKVANFPLCVQRILHIGTATTFIRDLKQSSQAPLERKQPAQRRFGLFQRTVRITGEQETAARRLAQTTDSTNGEDLGEADGAKGGAPRAFSILNFLSRLIRIGFSPSRPNTY